jgi:hypothetical protein
MAKSPKCLGFSSANNDRAPTVLKSDFIKRTADDDSDCDSDGDYYPILHTDSESDDDDVYHCNSGDEDEQPLPSATRSKEKSPWVSASSSSQAKAAISCPCVPVEFCKSDKEYPEFPPYSAWVKQHPRKQPAPPVKLPDQTVSDSVAPVHDHQHPAFEIGDMATAFAVVPLKFSSSNTSSAATAHVLVQDIETLYEAPSVDVAEVKPPAKRRATRATGLSRDDVHPLYSDRYHNGIG